MDGDTRTRRQARVSHPAIGIKTGPNGVFSFHFGLARTFESCKFVLSFYVFIWFSKLLNLLYSVYRGMPGRSHGSHPYGRTSWRKDFLNRQREQQPKAPLALVQSSFGLAGIESWNSAMLNFSPLPKKGRKGKYFCHLYEVKGEPANRLF